MGACEVLIEHFRLFAWAQRRRRLSAAMKMSSTIRRVGAIGSFDCDPSRPAEPTEIPTKIAKCSQTHAKTRRRVFTLG